MPGKSKVHIAGVGSADKDSSSSLVSAATKALLDAGITYDNVTHGARRKSSSQGAEAFRAFGDEGVPVSEVDGGSELQSSFTMVQDRGEQCVLAITADKVCFWEQEVGLCRLFASVIGQLH